MAYGCNRPAKFLQLDRTHMRSPSRERFGRGQVGNAARQPLSERIVAHSRKLGTQLGVGIQTDEDRMMAKLLQTPKASWIGSQCRIPGNATLRTCSIFWV